MQFSALAVDGGMQQQAFHNKRGATALDAPEQAVGCGMEELRMQCLSLSCQSGKAAHEYGLDNIVNGENSALCTWWHELNRECKNREAQPRPQGRQPKRSY